MEFTKWLHGKSRADFYENLALTILTVGLLFTIVGITAGTYVPGVPVLIAMIGAFFLVVGVLGFILAELYRIVKEA